MQLKIHSSEDISEDVKKFVLTHPEEKPLPAFKAGAHIELTLKSDKKSYIRRYSLISDPEDLSYYVIAVLKVPLSAGGSQFLHERVSTGDIVNVEGPFNAFSLNDKAARHVFIAGGIGVTPFIPMIKNLSEKKSSLFEVHYAARTEKRFVYKQYLQSLADDRISFYTDNEDGRHSLDLKALIEAQSSDTHIYVCGPRTMIESTKNLAQMQGFPETQIHYESFGASVKPEDKPIKVTLSDSKKEFIVEPGQTILDALLENGISAPYGCKRGECGACALEVISGVLDARDVCLSDDKRKSHICTCISWAKSESLQIKL